MKLQPLKMTLLVIASTFSAHSFAAQPTTTTTVLQLSSDTALQLTKNAVSACQAKGYKVTATVVDTAGNVQAQLRSDGAGTHTLESSRKKAFTAMSMKQPTAKLMKLIADKPFLQPLKDMDNNLLLLAGGLPIIIDQKIVGAIGVGGAPGGHLDVQCAEAAIKNTL